MSKIVPLLLIASALQAQTFSEMDRVMESYRLDAHIPGMVWGVVQNGKLVHVRGAGVQDVVAKRPVGAESLFRIASMTKSFTALSILKLRDEGKLSLDAAAEAYVPEMRGWKYPTADSPRIRVRDLLAHTAGFVTDDPWGDRQTPMPEEAFTRLLSQGVPFTRAPGMAMEYSNLGYAILGRIVANVSGMPYKDFVQKTLLGPLGMTSSGFDVMAAPEARRALGYRWEDGAWKLEPTMAHGAFGAMGGLQTSATDYAKYVAFLLAAWPPRDGADSGPVKRASVRELSQGLNFASLRARPSSMGAGASAAGASGAGACPAASAYGMGMFVAVDCELGLTLSHGGGYPGYGSFVLLLPESGLGLFAFANRTYAGPRAPLYDAALLLRGAGLVKGLEQSVSPLLEQAYVGVRSIFASGSVMSSGGTLAMNFLMDRDAAHWAADLAALRAEVGACDMSVGIVARAALSGEFVWNCERGRVKGDLLLAPTLSPQIQALKLVRVVP
jgi:serine-type D-Ala-D-Ala carboxypeptidase/endopeptidase